MSHISVTNWSEFQHYKNRNPPWIRLYSRLIDGDDLAYDNLPDGTKLVLIHLWLLASRHNNEIPYDIEWLQRRLHVKTKKLNAEIQALSAAGFIAIGAPLLALPKQDAPGGDVSDSELSASASASAFEEVWAQYPKKAGRRDAFRHFKRTVKTVDDVPRILEALRRYKGRLVAEGKQAKFIKDGSTWFNCWEDDEHYEPPVIQARKAVINGEETDWEEEFKSRTL